MWGALDLVYVGLSGQQATGASVIPNNVADHGRSTELWPGQHKKRQMLL